jgi:very-short-patch-repair endonuclease
MGYTQNELSQLGIEQIVAPGRGMKYATAYRYKCACCGRPVQRFILILDRPVYCNICKTNAIKRVKAAEEEAHKRELELILPNPGDADKKIRFEKAVAKIQKHGNYDAAIKKAETAYRKYDSIPEAVAAIVLLHAGYKVIVQQPVADYKLDFVLPDEKIIIEVDGALFHKDEIKRELRDMSIRYNLGGEWKIIHVPAESLAKDPKAFERLMKRKINSIS